MSHIWVIMTHILEMHEAADKMADGAPLCTGSGLNEAQFMILVAPGCSRLFF